MTQLESNYNEFQQIFNAAADGMCVIARDFTVLKVNDAFTAMTGFTREQTIGQKCYTLTPNPYCQTPSCPMLRIADSLQCIDFDITFKNGVGDEIDCILTATPLLNPSRELTGIVTYIKDITERKRHERELITTNQNLEKKVIERTQALKGQEDQLVRLLYTDTLTSLPNRLRLLRDVAKSKVPVVALINIDDFEQINNFYGYAEGDFILVSLARLLSDILPNPAYALYKMHADEYAIFLDAQTAANLPAILDNFEGLAKHIASTILTTRFSTNHQEVLLRVSTGIAFTASADPKSLVIKADIALREARAQRKPYLFFREADGIDARYQDNIKWAKLLQEAIKYDRIVPYFQAIYNHRDPNNRHYEVLARLVDNRGKIISPHQFLDVAKATRQYPAITKAIIQKSFSVFKHLPNEISINLDVEDMLDLQTTTMIHELLEKYNMTRKVAFEVLENHSLESHTAAVQFLKNLKTSGCKLAVDDFGSGYSNFAYVLSLDFDYLKIDASLIRNIDQDASSQSIVKSIVAFAQDMGIKTIAEFVHSESVFTTVQKYNIDFSQGYYIARPGPQLA
ncbi:bifunctional diguanylate cyclase/phosphodiesterase [Sporomusa sp.]|uniref:bifunctional diguanylate cyclase/phosphodiesterase n=1 Tax=Sporomusa sp. TaxID=2078658 RepID=UPI002C0FC3EA|nr:EAL domain-containing protein [Sporomusa sp.]HWR41856.1 EAL domain-containing protein [Sporomusa sp.]